MINRLGCYSNYLWICLHLPVFAHVFAGIRRCARPVGYLCFRSCALWMDDRVTTSATLSLNETNLTYALTTGYSHTPVILQSYFVNYLLMITFLFGSLALVIGARYNCVIHNGGKSTSSICPIAYFKSYVGLFDRSITSSAKPNPIVKYKTRSDQ